MAMPLGGTAQVNQPPVLDPIQDHSLATGETWTVVITASDPNGDEVTLSAEPLETWMSFDGETFTASPGMGDAGVYLVTFSASDGVLTSTDTIMLTVADMGAEPPEIDLAEEEKEEEKENVHGEAEEESSAEQEGAEVKGQQGEQKEGQQVIVGPQAPTDSGQEGQPEKPEDRDRTDKRQEKWRKQLRALWQWMFSRRLR